MNVSWKDKKVAVLGLGVEGLSSARYLIRQGASVTILDENVNPDPDRVEAIDTLGAVFSFGEGVFNSLYKEKGGVREFDYIVRSPGISVARGELQRAKEAGIIITSQTQIFFEACPAEIIGVTGTKGKGTTSTLIAEMLKASGQDVHLGGNIGLPPLDFIDSLTEQSVVVLELSSFQLEDLTKSPHIAVMLMIVPEHLGADAVGTRNYHASMEDYVTAKRNILTYQTPEDFAVINRDYIASNESDIYTEGKVFYVTRERTTTEQGCFVRDRAIWIRMQGTEWKIIDTEEIALPGRHNLENACAAVMAATLAGAVKSEIVKVLQTFKGLEHRLELVSEVNGVRWYDDSFSTTPETAIAAIEAFESPEILILGGASKNSDFSELGELIGKKTNIKAIIGIGAEWERIKQSLNYSSSEARDRLVPGEARSSRDARTVTPVLLEGAKDMQTIVQAAAKIATPGDVVLLSPACTSFGMFQNYKDRGEQFKAAVSKLS